MSTNILQVLLVQLTADELMKTEEVKDDGHHSACISCMTDLGNA